MEKQSSRKPFVGLFILLFLGVIILGFLAILQNREIKRLSEEKPEVVPPAVIEKTKTAVVEEVIGERFMFRHSCEGTVLDGKRADWPVKYCIGKNTLEFIDDRGQTTIIAAEDVAENGGQPPILLKTEVVSSGEKPAHILVAFQYDACLVTGECREIGVPVVFGYNYSIDVSNNIVKQLKSFPLRSRVSEEYWNKEGTRAIFIEDTCGEGGCIKAPLGGYDLEKDVFTFVTNVKAVGGDYSDADVAQFGPRWKSVEWKTEKEFAATIINPNGTKKIIKGTF